MSLLKFSELAEVREKAIEAGLAAKRDALIAWFPQTIQAQLPGANAPDLASALALDLNQLNQWAEPIGGEVLLVMWLRVASSNSLARPSLQAFFSGMAELAERRSTEQAMPPVGPAPATNAARDVAVPERILFRSTLLPDAFITLAALRARSVARLTVPQIENDQPRLAASGHPAQFFGTGWLIGPQHLITNWHVVSARGLGEAAPSAADFAAQGQATKVEFDYVAEGQPPIAAAVAELVHSSAGLDYAILRLAAPAAGREPLPLLGRQLTLDPADPLATNIIQHPGGAPRQLAIRNNLAAVRSGIDLAYFTDTAGGSSGSPVCNDQWQVIALHKASTPKFGDFSFQGKSTAWVNVGTTIPEIIADLQAMPALWSAIGAVVV